jgi:hypothetical protein
VIILILLLIVGSTVFLVAPANFRFLVAAITKTTPTVGAATATASVIAANPNPYPPGGGQLILYDPLKNNSNNLTWQQTSVCTFKKDGYHVIQGPIGWFTFCTTRSADFKNFVLEVAMKIITGDGGGITLRSDTTYGKYSAYALFIRQDGHYFLNLYKNGRYVRTLIGSSNSAIKRDLNQTNLIAVVAKGNTITVYVNHQQIAAINDATFSQGLIGFIADATRHSADVVYTNAKVWAL